MNDQTPPSSVPVPDPPTAVPPAMHRPVPEPPAGTATAPRRGAIRNTLESFGMAVLMAILLKYFALEAYVIPTPSMQPTMMGSPETGETDRILVSKFHYLLHEPQRWDIAVFKYPGRQIQSYVKRIVGIGGDKLRIGGGNLARVTEDGKGLLTLRKPERVQRTLWREIYPMRRKLLLYEDNKDVGAAPAKEDVYGKFFNTRGGRWDIDADGNFVATPRDNEKLVLRFDREGARNNYSDGYDLYVAATTRKDRQHAGKTLEESDRGDAHGGEAVSDLRIGFDLTPAKAPTAATVSIEVTSLQFRFALEIASGKATLTAKGEVAEHGKRQSKTLTSEPFDFSIAAGETTSIRFARRDDRLFAWRDGDSDPLATLDIDALAIRQKLAIGDVVPRIAVSGAGKSTFANVRIERDLHYTLSELSADTIIEVPEDHFFMMGDNTLGSADGRDWAAVNICVVGDRVVNPEKVRSGRYMWGNKRVKPFEGAGKPHDDDNPVPLYNGRMVFVDHLGQFHNLGAKIDQKSWGRLPHVEFLDEDGQPWFAKEEPRSFVPRAHIEGRPIVRFLRSPGALKFTSWIR